MSTIDSVEGIRWSVFIRNGLGLNLKVNASTRTILVTICSEGYFKVHFLFEDYFGDYFQFGNYFLNK